MKEGKKDGLNRSILCRTIAEIKWIACLKRQSFYMMWKSAAEFLCTEEFAEFCKIQFLCLSIVIISPES